MTSCVLEGSLSMHQWHCSHVRACIVAVLNMADYSHASTATWPTTQLMHHTVCPSQTATIALTVASGSGAAPTCALSATLSWAPTLMNTTSSSLTLCWTRLSERFVSSGFPELHGTLRYQLQCHTHSVAEYVLLDLFFAEAAACCQTHAHDICYRLP